MIKRHTTAEAFLAASREVLEQREAENNLILGLAATLRRDIGYYGDRPPLFLSVHLGDRCVGACLQTPPKNLIVYFEAEHRETSLREVQAYLLDNGIEIPGIIGERESARLFAENWSAAKGVSTVEVMHELVYRLDEVNEVAVADGRLRRAADTDFPLLVDWLMRFSAEAVEPISDEEARETCRKKLREGAYYLWETDRPVCLAGWTRPTDNGVSVGPVYTPVESRGKGYATSCVAALSRLLLRDYKFCSLFTDLSNPTANSIYRKIGYRTVGRVLQCGFG